MAGGETSHEESAEKNLLPKSADWVTFSIEP